MKKKFPKQQAGKYTLTNVCCAYEIAGTLIITNKKQELMLKIL